MPVVGATRASWPVVVPVVSVMLSDNIGACICFCLPRCASLYLFIRHHIRIQTYHSNSDWPYTSMYILRIIPDCTMPVAAATASWPVFVVSVVCTERYATLANQNPIIIDTAIGDSSSDEFSVSSSCSHVWLTLAPKLVQLIAKGWPKSDCNLIASGMHSPIGKPCNPTASGMRTGEILFAIRCNENYLPTQTRSLGSYRPAVPLYLMVLWAAEVCVCIVYWHPWTCIQASYLCTLYSVASIWLVF